MQTLTELIPRFRTLGGREAIRQVTPYASRVVTYAELDSLVGAAISYLGEAGIRRGQRLLIQAENSPEWVALFWASVARGVHVVPIDFNFSTELRNRIQSDCGARFTADAAVLQRLRERASGTATVEFEIEPASPDDIVEIIYTSGTTGEPQGIVHRHRNICANLEPFQREISKYRRWATPFQPVRILELLPLSHMFGQAMGLYLPVFLEGAVAFTNEIRAASIARLIHDNRVSVVVSVPRILEVMRNEALRQSPRPPNYSGAAIARNRRSCRAVVAVSRSSLPTGLEILGICYRRRPR
jgi:long-chain acyl-CoA synthetase